MRTHSWMLLLCACSGGKDLITTTPTDTGGDADTDADADSDTDADTDTDTDTDADTDTGTAPVWLLPICPSPPPDDGILVFDPATQITVTGNELVASFGYSCGCAVHVVGSCFGEEFSTDAVPMLDVHVLHDDGGEACEAFCYDGVRVDLVQVQTQYAETYGTATGSVDLQVHWIDSGTGPQSVIVPYAW
jgi:hypothetical protein